MTTNYEKLKALLRDLFQMDQADLDFGLYRIMNAKRDEIEKFLETDLLPQVKAELARHTKLDSGGKKAELDETIENAKRLGVNPDTVPKVLELRDELKKGGDLDVLENEVFSHLYNFFRRYYHEGDFLSLRRYKEGVYAIPYEGEEVKLYWANHDQYYIKSTEYLRNYTFKLRDNRRVHFRVVEADTEADNNKPQNGKERRFILVEADPVVVENGELFIRFNYHADTRKQAELNTAAVTALLGNATLTDWLSALGELRPTEKNPGRTLLAKHLDDFTARYAFDYFIHKDLGGFFRRELDFFIKNEIMHLDDVEDEAAPKVELYLSRIKALRKIAHKIIAFLEQLETFQKKLWLKKKFVVETNYCVSLDRVPQELYPQIIENKTQIEEWKRLFAIHEIEGDLATPGYRESLSIDFLKAHQDLVLDTRHFSSTFTNSLLSSPSILGKEKSIEDAVDGVLVEAENFHALRLLEIRFQRSIKCIYIDPPYNRGGNDFIYKDAYQHSSWLSMINDRLAAAYHLLKNDGVIFTSIDENERTNLDVALAGTFGPENRVEELIWAQNTTHSQSPTYSTNHEYIPVYAKNKAATVADPGMFREPKPGFTEIQELIQRWNPAYPPVAEVEKEIKALMDKHLADYKEELREMDLTYNEDTQKQDPWRGIYQYCNAEYRDKSGNLVDEALAREAKASIWVWQEGDASMPAGKQSPTTKDPTHSNFRFYKPPHPKTGKPCSHPKSGWRWPFEWHDGTRESFRNHDCKNRIVWGENEERVPRYKRFLHEVETNVAKSVIHDYTDGEKQVANLFGATDVFPNPKPSTLIERFVLQTCRKGEWVLDFFSGSGTTGQAVMDASVVLKGRLKFLLVEMGEHFQSTLLPRIKKLCYSPHWLDGKPKSKGTPEEARYRARVIKCLRLESYEDCLNNLQLKRTNAQDDLLTQAQDLREDYTLHYMLHVETRGSASLLNIQKFTDPFSYKLKVSTGTVGETKEVNVDLVETFNWLIGLKVKHIDHIRNVRVVEGTNPQGDRVLILWRNVAEVPNDKLDEWFRTQGYNTRDQEYDVIYVNGDNNLENLRRGDQTWKVRLIEEDFHRLMWECQDA